MVTLRRQIEYQTSDPNRRKVLNLKYFYSNSKSITKQLLLINERKSRICRKTVFVEVEVYKNSQ